MGPAKPFGFPHSDHAVLGMLERNVLADHRGFTFSLWGLSASTLQTSSRGLLELSRHDPYIWQTTKKWTLSRGDHQVKFKLYLAQT